ncbi:MULTISPECIES: ABC transporter substrate-binding protein [unclassified Frankia]|uniref:ABC transporter substrate-binding protein n=1 Tax=unclassified Frankia TaxID=2632575 RepID=UPI001EE4B1E9|nr:MULTISPECIES: ABC transporter substrate-binding protein [unclassified Frankia]
MVALAAAAAAIAGCGASAKPPAPAANQTVVNGAGQATYPVSVTNCGRTLRFDHAPTRVISGWPTNTDLLEALGLGTLVVGQYNTSNGTPAPAYAAAAGRVPVLSEGPPTKEQLLAARPDLIWADGSYLFDGQQLPTIADLAAQGTQVLILSGFCTDDATKAKVTDVDTDLATLGRIFGVEASAARLRADLDNRLAAVTKKVTGQPAVPVAMISTYNDSIYTYDGVYTDIAQRAGARNIYAGTLPAGQYYAELSKESIVKNNPATLVYLLSGGENEADARAFLARTLPTVRAVQSGRMIFLSQWDSTNLAGVQGVESLAAALRP